MKKLIKAVRWGVKEVDGERSIQLFDASGNKISGNEAYWKGSFDCSYNQLTSLQGAPREVGSNFFCSYNQLTSLQGAPREVGGNFDCYNNQLTSLQGAPREVGGGFYCYNNQLISLQGAPREIGGTFYCSNNKLSSLQGVSKEIGSNFFCYNNQLTSLDGAPKEIGGSFHCHNNQLTTLQGAPRKNSQDVAMRIFEAKLKRGYLFTDGILQKLIKQRKQGRYNIYKVQYIGSQKQGYVVQDGSTFSHGEALKQAFKDLQYKIGDRDTSEYENWTLSTKVNKVDMIKAYRKITGACSEGVKQFVESQELPDKFSVKQVIALTKNQYGHDEFVEFFK